MMRKEVLEELIEFRRPLDELGSMLSEYPWDSEEELVKLTSGHVLRVLDRFFGGKFTANQIDQWANMIECRDDIGFEGVSGQIVKQVIYELANPDLTYPLSKERAEEIRKALR